jgi:hypothetical protein
LSTEVSAQWAAQEFLRRKRARASLIEYSQSIDIPGVPQLDSPADIQDEETPIIFDAQGRPIGGGKLINRYEQKPIAYTPVESRLAIHHRVMMNAIQQCIVTPRGRLILLAPPGAAKSTYVDVVGGSWAMGRKPNTQVIIGSYATGIAVKQSRKLRSVVRQPGWSAIWDKRPILSDDQRALDDWSLSNGSSMMAAGMLAGITGNRCDLLILDDPVANREQADSATIREKIYAEYIDTAMTRAKPWMSVIIVMTRWQEDDLVGAILPENYEGESGMIQGRDGQLWNVVCIPAESEREDDVLGRKVGAFLWPEWFPREHWTTWRDNPRAARTWAALFQQRPAPYGGVHFNREMFQYYNADLPRSDN